MYRTGWKLCPVSTNIEVAAGDVCAITLCLKLTRKAEVMFHLAALIPIPYSYRAPSSFVETNVTGTLNMRQAALWAGVARMVQVSTSEVYGTARCVPIDEPHPLQAHEPTRNIIS